MPIIKKELILLPALLFCLAGCSSNDPAEGGNAGSFNVSISGSTSNVTTPETINVTGTFRAVIPQ